MRKIVRRILIGTFIVAAALYVAFAIFSRRDYQRVFPTTDRQITENADSFMLFSVSPDTTAKPSPAQRTGNLPYFHEYPVLGMVRITDAGQRKSLMDGLHRQWHPNIIGEVCFFPHHGIRAICDGKTVDYVLCFECGYIHVYRNGGTVPAVGVISHSAVQFNEILLKNKIPLPPQ